MVILRHINNVSEKELFVGELSAKMQIIFFIVYKGWYKMFLLLSVYITYSEDFMIYFILILSHFESYLNQMCHQHLC